MRRMNRYVYLFINYYAVDLCACVRACVCECVLLLLLLLCVCACVCARACVRACVVVVVVVDDDDCLGVWFFSVTICVFHDLPTRSRVGCCGRSS